MLDRVLDKGVVVDVNARISLVGIEVMTVEGQVVAASLDTYYENREEIGEIERSTFSDTGDGAAGGTDAIDADTVDAAGDAVESTAEAVEDGLESTADAVDEDAASDGENGAERGGGAGETGSDAGDDGDESRDGDGGSDSDESRDGDGEGVRCRVCDERYEAITPSHLATHDMTVEEYRERYDEDAVLGLAD